MKYFITLCMLFGINWTGATIKAMSYRDVPEDALDDKVNIYQLSGELVAKNAPLGDSADQILHHNIHQINFQAALVCDRGPYAWVGQLLHVRKPLTCIKEPSEGRIILMGSFIVSSGTKVCNITLSVKTKYSRSDADVTPMQLINLIKANPNHEQDPLVCDFVREINWESRENNVRIEVYHPSFLLIVDQQAEQWDGLADKLSVLESDFAGISPVVAEKLRAFIDCICGVQGEPGFITDDDIADLPDKLKDSLCEGITATVAEFFLEQKANEPDYLLPELLQNLAALSVPEPEVDQSEEAQPA